LALAVGVAGAVLLMVRPPGTPAGAARRAGVLFAVAVALAPAARLGYAVYPINLLVWGALLPGAKRDRARAGTVEAVSVAPAPPGSRVLDAGAGTGAMALLLAELSHDVTALDLSAEMLGRAAEKAEARGLSIRTVVAPATEPPPGPFDAVVERHLLWTVPDPVAALSAWRKVVAPGGRAVLFEGIFSRNSLQWRARGMAADGLRRALGVADDHHAGYDAELLD